VNPLILSVDTTHEFGSLALLAGEETVEEMLLHSKEGFSHILYDHLARLLERHDRKVEDVACFAAASGPGSFTGVRVGLACVKGLAEATGRPVAAVSNLEALASFGTGPIRAAVLDARRGEVYGAVYDAHGKPLVSETVMRFPLWLETLPRREIEFVSADFEPLLAGTRFEGSKITIAPRGLAAAVGRIACRRFQAGLALDPAEIDANYVRRSDAELYWKES
jgi:tRNA threonylcarbamoyladenosine biosynthesis protein TsaB